jgi:3-methyladenine DNA glycosylase AlkD
MNDIIKKIRQELKEKADEDVKRSGERFFKEQIKLYGMRTADVSKIGKDISKRSRNRARRKFSNYARNSGNRGIWKNLL